MKKKYSADFIFYQLGKAAWIPLLFGGLWFARSGYAGYGDLFSCSLRRIAGLPCPGCGGTRAVYYLFSGKFVRSFLYHPVVIVGILCYLHFMVRYFFRLHISKKPPEKEIQVERYVYMAVIVILLQWLLKITLFLNGWEIFI